MTAELLQAARGLEAPAAGGVVRTPRQQDVAGLDARALGLRLVQVVSGGNEDQRIHALLMTLRMELDRNYTF